MTLMLDVFGALYFSVHSRANPSWYKNTRSGSAHSTSAYLHGQVNASTDRALLRSAPCSVQAACMRAYELVMTPALVRHARRIAPRIVRVEAIVIITPCNAKACT